MSLKMNKLHFEMKLKLFSLYWAVIKIEIQSQSVKTHPYSESIRICHDYDPYTISFFPVLHLFSFHFGLVNEERGIGF